VGGGGAGGGGGARPPHFLSRPPVFPLTTYYHPIPTRRSGASPPRVFWLEPPLSARLPPSHARSITITALLPLSRFSACYAPLRFPLCYCRETARRFTAAIIRVELAFNVKRPGIAPHVSCLNRVLRVRSHLTFSLLFHKLTYIIIAGTFQRFR